MRLTGYINFRYLLIHDKLGKLIICWIFLSFQINFYILFQWQDRRVKLTS